MAFVHMCILSNFLCFFVLQFKQNQSLEHVRDIECLEEKVGQLQNVRERQAEKIKGLKSELDDTVR